MDNRSTYFDANRAVMAEFIPSHYVNVLEVGCASGGFIKYLQAAQEVWGIEPDFQAAELAKTKMTKVLCGRYDQVEDQLPDHYFDLIVCNDVIEHMVDHDAFFKAIQKKTRPGAVIIGSLPNIRHVTALFKILILKDWQYTDSGILDRTHLRFFTEKSIRRFFTEQNVTVEKFSGLGSVIRYGLSRPTNPLSAWNTFLFKLGVLLVVVVTLGYYWDTQYPQYGFRIRLKE